MFYKKRNLLGRLTKVVVLLFLLSTVNSQLSTVFAGDIEAELNTNNGTTSFDILDSDKVVVSSITSNGDIYGNLLRLKGTGNSYFLGNVGIGMTNPSIKFHVKVGIFDIFKVSNGIVVGSPTGGDRGTGSINAENIYSAGNVGIGTTSPDAKLDINGTVKVARYLTQAENSGITLVASDFGKTITVDSGTDQVVSLPSVSSSDIGAWFTIVKLGSGKVTLDAADTDTIVDSTAGGIIYNDASSGEDYASITLRLVNATEWIIIGGNGSWTTN